MYSLLFGSRRATEIRKSFVRSLSVESLFICKGLESTRDAGLPVTTSAISDRVLEATP